MSGIIKHLELFILALLIGLLPMCKKSSPTSPTSPPEPKEQVTVQALTVTSSSDSLFIGDTETFTATAKMSDGSTITVGASGTWSSGNSNVAAVNNSGLVEIVGSGYVKISVTYKGKQGFKAIRGLPNYKGEWEGSYVITSCSSSDQVKSILGFCNEYQRGFVFPCDFTLNQNQDQVTGYVYLDQLYAIVSGSIAQNGLLELTGIGSENSWVVDVSLRMQSKIPGRIIGAIPERRAMYMLFTKPSLLSGNGLIWCSLRDIKRTSDYTQNELSPAGLRLMGSTLEDLPRALEK